MVAGFVAAALAAGLGCSANVDHSAARAENAQIEDTTPVAPAISRIPAGEISNVPFPSGTIAATTMYSESDGHSERDVYTGNAGCLYGEPDSCTEGGNTDFESEGIIIDTVVNLDGIDPPIRQPTLVPGSGQLTLTGFAGGVVRFRSSSGETGSYSLSSRRVELDRRA